MKTFEGKNVMIAGAAGNLGAAVVQRYISLGAKVALVDRSEGMLADRFPDLINSTEHVFVECADLTKPEVVQQSVQQVLEQLGGIDVFITVVGVYQAGNPLHETPVSTFDFLMDINTRAFYIVSQIVVPIIQSLFL